MLPVEIKKDIYWVGAVDYASLDFHGYSISSLGTTYNCYLIKDEKTVLVDTVKYGMADVLEKNLEQLTDKIDYFIINHVELDHAGALQEMVEKYNPEKIYCSPMGKVSIEKQFDSAGWPLEVVKTGDIINIGKRNITFIETRLLHWPDSMFSYVNEDKLLFSNDAFGQNIASSERYADQVDKCMLEHAMSHYYFNIVLPFSSKVLSVVKQVQELNLDIDMIAPDHGLIFRGEYVSYAINKYVEYATQSMQKKALIFYDTMWHSTEKMANAIAEGLESAGISVKVMHLKQHHHSTVMAELATASLVIAGSPTHNNTVLPYMSAMLTYMKGLKPKNRMGASFCSYGWSGESGAHIQEQLQSMGFETPEEPLRVHFKPKSDSIVECVEFGKKLATAFMAKF